MNDNYQPGADLRWQSTALMALQEATEAYLVHLFEDACVLVLVQTSGSITTHDQQSLCYSRKTSDDNAAGPSAGEANKR